MLNCSASLAMSTSVLKALPGKLDIKRHSPSILYVLISWAAYYTSSTEPLAASPTKLYKLLLFNEPPKSPAMIWHGIKVLHQTINCINLGQTPVKDRAWRILLSSGNGGNAQKMLCGVSGDWLDGSGWITALTNSGILTSGKAQFFISIHHICTIRYTQQIPIAAFYMLMRKAYDHYVD